MLCHEMAWSDMMAEMPGGLLPVDHRPEAFADAVAEIDATLTRLQEALDDRLQRARRLDAQWHGLAASRFAGELTTRLLAVHHDVVGELEATRRNLLTTLDAIRDENAARARQRELWQRAQEEATP